MINTTQTTTYNLTLTGDEFDVLYELLDDTILDIQSHIEDTDLTLDDYEVYHIWRQLDRFKEANKIWLIQTMSPRIEVANLHQPWQITHTMIYSMMQSSKKNYIGFTLVFHRLYTIVVEKYHLTVDKGNIKCILTLY